MKRLVMKVTATLSIPGLGGVGGAAGGGAWWPLSPSGVSSPLEACRM